MANCHYKINAVLAFLGALLTWRPTTMKTGRSQEDMVTGMLPRRKSSKEWLEPQSLSFMEV